MDEYLIGFGAIGLAGIVTGWLALRHKSIVLALFAAYGARAGAAVVHRYITALPDGQSDARALESKAWEWGNDGFVAALGHFTGPDSYFYSWMLALFYSVVGRNHLMAQSLSVLAGIGSVYLVYRLATELWGEAHGRKAVWVAALFPTLVLYSALTMRETYVVFFLLLGLIGVVYWERRGGVWPTTLVFMGFGAATFFHGGMAVALLAFGGLLVSRHGVEWLVALRKARIRIFSTLLLFAVFAGVASYIALDIKLPKLGYSEELVDTDRFLHRFQYSNRGTASYPDWAVPKEESEILWKVPIRILYFLFGPFSWDLEKPSHLIGWLDGIFYAVIIFMFWRHWKIIWAQPEARAITLVLLPLVLVFGVAVSNFGTGLRHRAKFVAAALALIAPRLPRLVLRPGGVSSRNVGPQKA